MERIAVLRLFIPQGAHYKILNYQVVVYKKDSTVVEYYPLSAELPFTQWRRCDAFIADGKLHFGLPPQ